MAKKKVTAGMVVDQVLDYGKDAAKAALDAVTGSRKRQTNQKTDKQQHQDLSALTAEIRHLAQHISAPGTGPKPGAAAPDSRPDGT
ncbi:hypothetical protein OEIGOIKO_03404 [Streptomyces chrestomyceticus JCM 4735]|uniref:Uncharacterized protein n=1 Tax=Streptomyces chrestomyceticus JCM 4735 TaxID=1306181 RepID=A0A7U9KW51_9ACTN|nr:hypothetical protein [Streptomyces chrestomyceticus]GCD35658.1 hypothetical protein OEIGOIKO_03404 [Streptomyces chrestomyceticus JCM 4735]